MSRAQGSRSQMAVAFETVYGTPPASGSFWQMPFSRQTLGSEQNLLEDDILGLGRDAQPPTRDAITADGEIVVPIDARYIGVWLKALFGAPVTTGTGPYTHVFTSGSYALPSFSAEIGMPEVPYYAMVSGCKADSLSFQMQRSGLVSATVNVIAQGESTGAVSNVGTMQQETVARFGAFTGSISRNGSQLGNVVQGKVTYNNTLERVETIRADGKIDGADPGKAMMSGEIGVRFADTTLLDQATSGATCELAFKYQIDASNSLEIVAHDVYLPKPKVAIEGPAGVQTTFAWQAANDPVAGQMATVTLINDLADYDNPSN